MQCGSSCAEREGEGVVLNERGEGVVSNERGEGVSHFAVTGSGTHIRRLLRESRTCGSGVMDGDGEGMQSTYGGGTLVIVRAGDHWSFRMSRHMLPSGLTFG